MIQRWAVSKGRLLREIEETGGALPGPLLPRLHGADRGQGRRAPDGRRPEPPQAHLRRLRRSPLWQADRSGPARYPLADYIKHRMKGFFDLLIGDEVHEFKGRGSAQGIAAGILADVCGKSLSLTGTLLGGYSSTIFHLLYRFSPEIRTEFGRSDEHRWIQRYGFEEVTVGKPDDDAVEDGRNSRRRKLPQGGQGAARPRSLRAVSTSSATPVFLQPRGRGLRPARLRGEDPRVLDGLGGGRDGLLPAQRPTTPCSRSCDKELAEALKAGSKRLLATYLQTLLAVPRRLHQGGDGLRPPERGRDRAGAAPVRGEGSTPRRRRSSTWWPPSGWREGRVLVYVTHTGTQGHHGADGRHPHPARLQGGGDEGRCGGPEPP